MMGEQTSLIVVFTINCDLVFSLSFILSFSCSFILLALNRLLKIRWAFLKSLLIFTLIYIFNLPIIAKINNEINPLSLIFGIILAPIFEIYYLMSKMFFWSVDFMNFAYFILDKLLEKRFSTTKKEQNKTTQNFIWNLLPYVKNVFLKCWFYEFCLLYFRQIVRCINRFFVSTYNKDIIKLTYCLAKHLCLIYSTISRKHIYK